LNCITPVRFGVGGANKGATECGESMSDQLTIFSRGAFAIVCVKVDILERLYNDNLEKFYLCFIITNLYFTGAAYNFYFPIIYNLHL